jgi:hypothetical protein
MSCPQRQGDGIGGDGDAEPGGSQICWLAPGNTFASSLED